MKATAETIHELQQKRRILSVVIRPPVDETDETPFLLTIDRKGYDDPLERVYKRDDLDALLEELGLLLRVDLAVFLRELKKRHAERIDSLDRAIEDTSAYFNERAHAGLEW